MNILLLNCDFGRGPNLRPQVFRAKPGEKGIHRAPLFAEKLQLLSRRPLVVKVQLGEVAGEDHPHSADAQRRRF